MEIPKEQAKYSKLYAALNDSINTAAKKEVNQQFEKLVTNAEKEKDQKYGSILLAISCFVLVSGFAIWLLWKRNSRIVHKKYEELIAKINSENELNMNPEISTETTENSETKLILNITDETIKILLQKLIKFEKSHKYLRKEVTRSWLSDHLNTNNSYLTEIIKVHSNKNFNNYLNGLRIDYITKKLVENPVYREYKIEYLAEECGYGSRQVFVIAFKKETGFTPSYFIENLKKDSKLEYRE